MKHLRIFALLVPLLLLTAVAAPAFAETSIAVVNMQALMNDSKAAVAIAEQVKTKKKSLQANLDTKEKSFNAEKQALVKSRSSTSKEAFEQKVKEFESKAIKAQQEIQEKNAQMMKATDEALGEVQTNIIDITKQIASEKKLALVMTTNQVVYSDRALDITEEVMKRLNDKLPTVKLNF